MRCISLLLAALMISGFALAGQTGTRAMSGWFNVTSPDGWQGRRYMDGAEIFAEEFDSNGDNRMDVWRFYRRGILSSEERDLRGDGKVNYQSRWDPRSLRLVSVFRDTQWAGVNDLEIEVIARNRWEIREDRNRDGVADRILIAVGPPDLFEMLGMDLAHQENIIDNIPMQYWYELQSDDAFTCAITDYRRYRNGALTHYGQWNGRTVVWQRTPPDFVPPVPEPVVVAAPQPVDTAAIDPLTGQPYISEPYTTEPYAEPTGTFLSEPYTDPMADPFATEPDLYGAPSGRFRGPTDRTQYEGMPPGESAARSLPARMRPPGAGRR